jgi:hypothetical protein
MTSLTVGLTATRFTTTNQFQKEVISMKSSAKKTASAKTKTDMVVLLVATKKGGFILSSDNKRRKWDIKGPIFLGNIVHHMALDQREGRVL